MRELLLADPFPPFGSLRRDGPPARFPVANPLHALNVEFDQKTEREIRGKSFDWHSEAIIVSDGGDAFWCIEYDPRTKQLQNAQLNGVA
ncbi:MAG TPA: hypothetical protein VKM54_10450 [Myxococcota bacterium]|nr:hypothetical protein [Myxococcota bacterium]